LPDEGGPIRHTSATVGSRWSRSAKAARAARSWPPASCSVV